MTFFLLMVDHSVNISIQERTENFAIRVIQAYCELNKRHFEDAGKVLSKQFWLYRTYDVKAIGKSQVKKHRELKLSKFLKP